MVIRRGAAWNLVGYWRPAGNPDCASTRAALRGAKAGLGTDVRGRAIDDAHYDFETELAGDSPSPRPASFEGRFAIHLRMTVWNAEFSSLAAFPASLSRPFSPPYSLPADRLYGVRHGCRLSLISVMVKPANSTQ